MIKQYAVKSDPEHGRPYHGSVDEHYFESDKSMTLDEWLDEIEKLKDWSDIKHPSWPYSYGYQLVNADGTELVNPDGKAVSKYIRIVVVQDFLD